MVRLRLFLLLLTALVALSAFSVDAQKLVEYAVKNDITFQQSYLTYQQAVEDYQRSMIYSSIFIPLRFNKKPSVIILTNLI